jgi:hypothetical protein
MNEHDSRLDRLYDLLPVIYRQRDTELGSPLRSLLQVIAEQVNVVEDDIAQLYENWFIETCQDWVVPYIADLIGHRLVYEAGEPGAVTSPQAAERNKILVPRSEVASTIRYRRRKGTLALLELLARDVAGWPTRSAEFYQLLAASQHVSHLRLGQARTVDVRQGDALDRLEGAFDEVAHSVGVRRLGSRYTSGRHNINNTGLFVWRLKAYQVTRTPAFCVDRVRHHYTFSVLGNDAPLFTKTIEEPEPTHVADEMNVPAPIRRRALDERTADYYGKGKSIYIWRDGTDRPVPLSHIVAADLSNWAYIPQGRQVAVDPRLGRIAFSSRNEPKTGVWVTYQYGFSADIGDGEYQRILRLPDNVVLRRPQDDTSAPVEKKPSQDETTAVQPGKKPQSILYLVSQQYQRPAPHTSTYYFNSINRALDAWRADDPDHAIIQIEDSGAYVEQLEIRFLRENQRLEIRAANGRRPSIRLLDWYTNRPDSLGIFGPPRLVRTPPDNYERSDEEDEERPRYEAEQSEHPRQEQSQPSTESEEQPSLPPRVTLDGLLISGRSVFIEGSISEVLIRHCTLVPGWTLDVSCNPENETEPSLELSDTSARLTIEHSIVGSIVIDENQVAVDPIQISISDSVLDATRTKLEALSGPDDTFAHAELRILRSTIFGLIRTHAITLAENSIFDGRVNVARSQTGCVRFCYVPPDSRTPRRYNCQPDLVAAGLQGAEREQAEMRVRPQFNSVRYGTPTYCQLAETCATEIKRGADDESEMGVFHDLFQPQREANLRARLDEFTPAGMDAGLIFVT